MLGRIDLSPDARLLYTSDSIVDILGYNPQEVVGRSCFDYFHPEEIPFARTVHDRGVQMDKAAVLNYCRIRSKYGHWVGCECVFTIVYDVLVASTSIYRVGMKSQSMYNLLELEPCNPHADSLKGRAVDAPIIRRLFSSSPRDPRYHMLSHLSAKFSAAPSTRKHEPRAALFLNRFTRTLAIMYATTALASVLGVTAEEAKGKSFYECIQENCLPDAIRCLEGAKANDSIAYMRFWFRDPRPRNNRTHSMSDVQSSDEDDDGGVHLDGHLDERMEEDHNPQLAHPQLSTQESQSSSGYSTDQGANSGANVFGDARMNSSSDSSTSFSDDGRQRSNLQQPGTRATADPVEVEAVVSCTSDGLVVILRRARPIFTIPNAASPPPVYTNGLFASPWAAPPIMPSNEPSFSLSGQGLPPYSAAPVGATHGANGDTGPPVDAFMNSIREVAVFAWALTGINGSLADYSRGHPTGEAQPAAGLPIWDPNSDSADESPPPKTGFAGTMVHQLEHQIHGNRSDEAPPQSANASTPYNGRGGSSNNMSRGNGQHSFY